MLLIVWGTIYQWKGKISVMAKTCLTERLRSQTDT